MSNLNNQLNGNPDIPIAELDTLDTSINNTLGDWVENASGNWIEDTPGDWIEGTDESDFLEGTDGDDVLEGGEGFDVMEGGEGHDTYLADDGDFINDSDQQGNIEFNGEDLTGEKILNPETGNYEDNNFTYKEANGNLEVMEYV